MFSHANKEDDHASAQIWADGQSRAASSHTGLAFDARCHFSPHIVIVVSQIPKLICLKNRYLQLVH
jgi:hypothetical protein